MTDRLAGKRLESVLSEAIAKATRLTTNECIDAANAAASVLIYAGYRSTHNEVHSVLPKDGRPYRLFAWKEED